MFKYLTYLLISEILFHPVSGGYEYVELYNNSDSAISLKDIRLAKCSENEITTLYEISDNYEIAPHDYAVITKNALWVVNSYRTLHPNKVIEVTSMPTYANTKGSVVIATKDSVIIDRLDYTNKMHSPLIHDDEGIALERRSFETETQNPDNWFSASSTSGYGTPTYQNSQSTELLYVDDDFHLSSDIISPDGDGYQDLLDITYSLNNPDLSANITIYNHEGRIMRHLLNNEILGMHGQLTWNGLSDDGARCPRGNYIIVIEAYNRDGIKQISKKSVTLIVR